MNGRSAMLLSLAAVLLVVQQTHGAIDFEIFDTTFGNTECFGFHAASRNAFVGIPGSIVEIPKAFDSPVADLKPGKSAPQSLTSCRIVFDANNKMYVYGQSGPGNTKTTVTRYDVASVAAEKTVELDLTLGSNIAIFSGAGYVLEWKLLTVGSSFVLRQIDLGELSLNQQQLPLSELKSPHAANLLSVTDKGLIISGAADKDDTVGVLLTVALPAFTAGTEVRPGCGTFKAQTWSEALGFVYSAGNQDHHCFGSYADNTPVADTQFWYPPQVLTLVAGKDKESARLFALASHYNWGSYVGVIDGGYKLTEPLTMLLNATDIVKGTYPNTASYDSETNTVLLIDSKNRWWRLYLSGKPKPSGSGGGGNRTVLVLSLVGVGLALAGGLGCYCWYKRRGANKNEAYHGLNSFQP